MGNVKALSYSEMSLFWEDRDEWRKRYIDGVKSEGTKPQQLGIIIHEFMETRDMAVAVLKLGELGLPGRQLETVKRMLKQAWKLPLTKKCEHKSLVTLPNGEKLFMVYDGFDPELRFITEYKTGNTDRYWNQNVVDGNEQLSFYAFGYYLDTRQFLRGMVVYAMNTTTGLIKAYPTTRGPMDLKVIADKIGTTIDRMQELDLWQKRISGKIRATVGV